MKPFLACFKCPERRGLIRREVREVEPSKYLEAYLADHLADIPTPVKDLRRLYQPDTRIILVDEVGVLIKGNLLYNGMPDVHVGFWDRVLAGREEMCYTVAEAMADDAGSPGVWTAIPESARATLAFARRVGFQPFRQANGAVALDCLFHDATRETPQWVSKQQQP